MRLIGSIIVVYLHENRCNITRPTGDCEAHPTGDRIQCSPRFLLKGKSERMEGRSPPTSDRIALPRGMKPNQKKKGTSPGQALLG